MYIGCRAISSFPHDRGVAFAAFFVLPAAAAQTRIVTSDKRDRFAAVTAHDIPGEKPVAVAGVVQKTAEGRAQVIVPAIVERREITVFHTPPVTKIEPFASIADRIGRRSHL